MAEKTGLDNLLAPYGTSKNAGETALPSWLKDAKDFFDQNDDAGKRAFAMLYQAQLNAEATGQAEPMSREARDDLVNGRVGVWQFMNMAGAQSPFSVNMDSKMRAASDLFYDSYSERIGQEGGYDTFTQAVAAFNQDFPEFANAGISINAESTGINASYGAQTAAEQWRKEIARDPNMARVLIGPTAASSGDYTDEIAEYQKSNQVVPGGSTWRAGLSQDNLGNVLLVENGKREWSRFNMLLAEKADEAGIEYEDPKMASLRKQFRDTFMAENHGEWYSEYTSDSYQKNEIVGTLASARAALEGNPEAMETTPHLQSLAGYIQGRDEMKAMMDQAGFATTESQEFAASPLGYEWASYTSNLLQSDPEFERLYYEIGLDADNLQFVLPEVG
jgi:SLT domain-containing protein